MLLRETLFLSICFLATACMGQTTNGGFSSGSHDSSFRQVTSTAPLSKELTEYEPVDFFSQEPNAEQGSIDISAAADGSGGGGADSGKQSQNPIASLATVPIQNNWNFGTGSSDETQYVGLVQPVIPLKINKRWNLITRPILPLINSPAIPFGRSHGLGDLNWQNFFVPVPPKGSPLTWGIGPSFIFPTASDASLGLQRWGAGVSGVVVIAKGPVVGGFLVNQNFVEGGVSQPFLIQPFYNYNFQSGHLAKKKYFIAVSGEFNADWRSDSDNRWNNVLGIGPGRIINMMGQPMNITTRFAPYVESPSGGSDWQFRLLVNLLFPK